MCKKHFKIFENNSVVNELNLFPIKEIFAIDLQLVELNNVYLSKENFPDFDSNKNLTVREILESSIKILIKNGKENVLKKGYAISCIKGLSHLPTEMNSTNSFFRKKHWTSLFRYLGDNLSIFILTNCYIVEKINNHFVLLAGDPWSLLKRKKYPKLGISPSYIYKKTHKLKKINLKEFIQFMQAEIFDYSEIFLEDKTEFKDCSIDLSDTLSKIVKYFNRMDVNAIFSSKFSINLNKPIFITEEMKVKKEKIVNFLYLISKKVLKNTFTSHSLSVLKSKFVLFFDLRNKDYLEKNDLLSYFKFQDPFLQKIPFNERIIYFEKIILFLFKKIFFPIIFNCFYASKTSYSKLEVLYFIRKEWEHYSEISINNFLNNFFPVYQPSYLKNDFISNLKVVPKNEGFRVITNMKASRKHKYLEVYLFEKLKNKLNNSSLSHYDFSHRLKEYLSVKNENYFLKFDLKHCYDNLPHDKLIQFLEKMLKEEDDILIQGYNVIESKKGMFNYKPNKKCFTKRTTLNEILKIKKQKNNQEIFEDCFFYEKNKQKLLKIIKENIINYKIKHKEIIYQSKKGIPQGNVFSSLICSLYLGYLDEKYFNKFIKKGILIRYIDDFLVISQEKKEICELFSIMLKMKEYGIYLNLEKIQSNFNIIEEYTKLFNTNLTNNIHFNETNFVTWAGLKILSDSFSIKCFFRTENMKNSFLVDKNMSLNYNIYKIFLQCEKRIYKIFYYKENLKVNENIYDFFYCFFIKLFYLLYEFDFLKGKEYNLILNYNKLKKENINNLNDKNKEEECLIYKLGNLNYKKIKSKHKSLTKNILENNYFISKIEFAFLNELTEELCKIIHYKLKKINENISFIFLRKIALNSRKNCLNYLIKKKTPLMKYKVILKGEFENVKEIAVEQTFEVKVICVACRTESEKPMIVTSDSHVRKDVGVHSLIYTCNTCKRQLSVDVRPPKPKEFTVFDIKTKSEENISLPVAIKEEISYTLSEIFLSGCELLSLKVFLFNLIDKNNLFYSNVKCDLKENNWTGDFENSFSSMINYSVSYELTK